MLQVVGHPLGYALQRPVRPAGPPDLCTLWTAAELATGYTWMFRAAFRSRLHAKPQQSQRQVRSDSGRAAFTALHALQGLPLANHGSTSTNCAPCHAHLYAGIRTNSARSASEMERAVLVSEQKPESHQDTADQQPCPNDHQAPDRYLPHQLWVPDAA